MNGLQHCHNAAYNHKHAHCTAQSLAAYLLKAPGSKQRANEYASHAHSPQREGVVGEKSRFNAECGVKEVEHHRKGLHCGYIFHFVLYGTYAVEYYRGARHCEHSAHYAAYGSYRGPCAIGLKGQSYAFLPKEEVEGNRYKHHAQATFHCGVAGVGYEFYCEVGCGNVEEYYHRHAAPTYMPPVPQGYEEGGGACQQPRKGDALAIRWEYEREEHHYEYAEPEPACPLYEAGSDG